MSRAAIDRAARALAQLERRRYLQRPAPEDLAALLDVLLMPTVEDLVAEAAPGARAAFAWCRSLLVDELVRWRRGR